MAYNLLGMFQPQQSQMQTLLGEYYDPKAARMAWLGGALQAAGAGLASGRPGAWAEGLALGGGQGNENYRRRALVEYGIKNQQDREAKADKRYDAEWAYRVKQDEEASRRQAETDERAKRLYGYQIADRNRLEGQRQAQEGYVTDWMGEQEQRGVNLLPQNIRSIARRSGVESAVPALDESRYDNAQPFVGAQDYENAFKQISAQPSTDPPDIEEIYDQNGQAVKVQWKNGQWVPVGGSKAPSGGITVSPDGTVQVGGAGGKLTEGDKRARLLGNQVATQEPIILDTFDALSDPQNLAGTTVPGGRYVMTSSGKAAYDAISNIVGNWLYLVSGATATDDEVRKRTNEILPSYGDDPRTISLKKARLQSYINGMKQAAGIAPGQQHPATGDTSVDVDALVDQYTNPQQ